MKVQAQRGMVAHPCNSSTQEAEAGGVLAENQSGLFRNLPILCFPLYLK
jgi:hypothetical protein